MEGKNSNCYLLLWMLLLSHCMLTVVTCRSLQEGLNDQKNYYSHDPHRGGSPRPHHKKSPKARSCGTPPPPPPPPPSCGTTPSRGGGGGGGSYHPHPVSSPSALPPPSPTSGGGGTPPSIEPSPAYGGGTPPSIVTPPASGGRSPPSLGTPPVSISPPSVDPRTPAIPSIPPPTGTCSYWRSHPGLVWGLVGYWGTVGGVFGVPIMGRNLTLMQALSSNRGDGIGSLYREGTASLLNSMVSSRFPLTTQQVRDRFVAGLSSDKAAASQARLFKLANEGRLKI